MKALIYGLGVWFLVTLLFVAIGFLVGLIPDKSDAAGGPSTSYLLFMMKEGAMFGQLVAVPAAVLFSSITLVAHLILRRSERL
jgi:hypothetical protein